MKTFLVLLLLSIPLRAEASITGARKPITVVFRFDDYSSRSSTEIETKLIDTFQEYNIRCTFGVIPYVCASNYLDPSPQDLLPLTPTKANILSNAIKAGILEVALHGYSHQTVRTGVVGGYTEFSRVDYNTQVEKIARGKQLLQEMLNTRVTTFIPPWNGFDSNTIRALTEAGFKTMSAGLRDLRSKVKSSHPLKFLPATCELLNLRNAVESARRFRDAQPVIVVLFHEYDFLEVDNKRGKLTYQDFRELLAWLTSQQDVHVRSLDDTSEAIVDLGARRFISNRETVFHVVTPPFLGKLYPFDTSTVYLGSRIAHDIKMRRIAFVCLFYLAIVVISATLAFLGGLIVFPRSNLVSFVCLYGGPAAMVLLSIHTYALRHHLGLSYRNAVEIVMLLGASIGV